MNSSKRQWWIFFSTSLLIVLMNIDLTGVNLALAPIAQELRLSIFSVQSIISAYLIGGAALVTLGGLLGDLYGRKKIFLTGTALFTLASIAVGLAHADWAILLGRLFQGFGAALSWPLAIVIVREAFVGREGFAMGLITAVMGISMSIGTPLAGLILHYLDWRWIFFINIPVGILVFAVGAVCLPSKEDEQTATSFHIPSAVVLVVGLLLFVFALSEMSHFGLGSPRIGISLILGTTLLVSFAHWQTRLSNPLIDMQLFTQPNLMCCFIVRFLWQVIWIAAFMVLSLLLQNILDYSSAKASLYFLAITGAFACVAPFGGQLSEKYGARFLINIAFILYAISFAGFALSAYHLDDRIIIALLMLFGIGTGVGMPALMNETLRIAPAKRRGMVSGILYGMNFFGGAIGAILIGALINYQATRSLLSGLSTMGFKLAASAQQLLIDVATGVQNVAELNVQFGKAQALIFTPLVTHSFLQALSLAMAVFVAICVANLALTRWIREK